MPYSQKEQIC